MKKIFLFSMMALGIALASCSSSEDELTPSGKTDGYKIAEGDADYDKTIANFYNKYGSCLLYEWTEKDAYWTPSGWKNGILGSTEDGAKDGYLVYAPQKEYIANQLHLLDRLWFRFYSDQALKKLLPVKILLCSNVQEATINWDFSVWPPQEACTGTDVSAYYNYDNIAVSYASDKADNLTNSDSLRICTELNTVFFKSMTGRSMISIPAKFSDGIDYTNAGSVYNNSDFFARGFFPDTQSYDPSADKDWTIILNMMVTYSDDFLSQAPQSQLDEWTHEGDAFYEGILNPAKDVNGLIKKRYDVARQYFIDNFGTDLQAIGNAAANWK